MIWVYLKDVDLINDLWIRKIRQYAMKIQIWYGQNRLIQEIAC